MTSILFPIFCMVLMEQQRSRKGKVQSTSHLVKKLIVLQHPQCLETNALKPVLPNTEVNHQFSKNHLKMKVFLDFLIQL